MGTARGSSVSQGRRPSGDVSSPSTGSSDSTERRQRQFAAGLLSAVTAKAAERCHRQSLSPRRLPNLTWAAAELQVSSPH